MYCHIETCLKLSNTCQSCGTITGIKLTCFSLQWAHFNIHTQSNLTWTSTKPSFLWMFTFYRINTYIKLLRISTQQYRFYKYCRFQTVYSPQIIIYFMSQLYTNIYTKRKIASKKQKLDHKCMLQESCKTVRRWQRSTVSSLLCAISKSI